MQVLLVQAALLSIDQADTAFYPVFKFLVQRQSSGDFDGIEFLLM
jgi:hypothetical protein